MIVCIGIMIGFYILTRALSISCDKQEYISTKILSAITFIITIFCLIGLIMSGSSFSSLALTNSGIFKSESQSTNPSITEEIPKEKYSSGYMDYYQLIRERILQKVKENSKNNHGKGNIAIEITLNSDGSLGGVYINNLFSTKDKALREIVMKSVESAAPFPPFPQSLTKSKMSFNLTISFNNKT